MPLHLIDRWLAPAPEPARVAWLARHRYAHRGLHGAGRPENSLAAFMAAMAGGIGIECDVRKSADGRAMVFHDAALDRLTGEQGPLGERTVADLTAMTLCGTDERIPTLRDALRLIGGIVPLLIEVKTSERRPVSALCLAVRRDLEGYRGPHAVMSFDPRVSRWFAIHSPDTVRGLVVSEGRRRSLAGLLRRHAALWRAQPDFIACDVRDLPSRFAAAQRRRGLPLLTWTVDTHELAERAGEHADAPIAEGEGVDFALAKA